jgi:twinkle protein
VRLIEDNIDLSAYLQDEGPRVNIVPASSFFEEVRDEFLNPREMEGARTPWDKMDSQVRLRPGEVSLWPGVNDSGKSLITSQVALNLCAQEERVCIASFEMPPRKTMKRMTRQAATGPEPSLEFIRKFHKWTDDRLWIFNHLGQIEPKRVVAAIKFCADKFKITHFFLDSLMRCVRGEDDYNGQKDFVTDLCSVAQETGIHVHLIHHTKKPADDSHKPTRFDAKGSGSISDQVDNVFCVWRNKPKERDLEFAQFKNEEDRQKVMAKPDALVICDKQRHGEWEGWISLWFDQGSQTFRGEAHGRPAPLNL